MVTLLKIGKTEFCTMAPDSLILAFEIGTNARPGAIVQKVDSWSTFKLVLRQLESPEAKEKFSTVCIDTVGIAWDICEQFICAQNGKQKIADIPYGAGWSALSKEFDSSLRKITMLGYGLIMTCHLKEITDDDGRVYFKPDLKDRCYNIVNGLADIIGVITKSWDDKGECHRWIQTRATPQVFAGSRFKYMPPRIPFSYSAFTKALGEAIDKEAENGAIVVDHTPIDTSIKISYKDVRDKATDLWDELIKKDPINAERIIKKAEIIFGHTIKLSEITEDQVELFNLLVIEMEDMLNE